MGYTSQEFKAGRISRHGKITALPFSLEGNERFSVFLIPKATDSDNVSVVLSAKLYHDETASDMPVVLEAWSEGCFIEIPSNASILSDYDIYWGAGE